ncbi:universal stress protein [Tamlana crocina]|uniref:Universal stress protein n=1 Tax=Tamlana crocina TaxID=393006 RepID=A0ABX1DD56_9FLAO|nr:universal stress protein [Tamlana crocina]NJX16285.1 universal stress protein [Tamlana crocina]
MKRVLLPTDFSENSISAINYAMVLLKSEPCDFFVFNVQKASSYITDDMMIVSADSTVYRTLIDSSKKSVEKLIGDLKTNFANPKHTFHSLVDYDNFIDAINQVVKEHDIDFIIMGTKGASGIEKMIFGSNTARVIQQSNVPVLAIPKNVSFSNLDRLVFLTSNLKQLDAKSLQVLKYLVDKNHTDVKFLSTGSMAEKAEPKAHLASFLELHFPNAEHDFLAANDKSLYHVVHDYTETHAIKWLCMVGKHHSFIERLFSGHPIENLAFKIHHPFLVLHNVD